MIPRSEHQFRITSNDRIALLSAPAYVGGWNDQQLWEAVAGAVPDHTVVVVDFSATVVWQPSALFSPVTALDWASSHACKLWVVTGKSAALRMFFTSGCMGKAFSAFRTTDEALAAAA